MGEKKEQTVSQKNSSLPSIPDLFLDSWELFKETWVSYLKVLGLFVSYLFLAFLVGILISLPVTFVAIGSHFQIFRHLTPFHIATLILLGLWFILFFLSIIVIDIIFPIVSIIILQGNEEESIIDLIKQSKRFFWPYLLTALMSSLIIVGGMFLVVIPGLLIALFFAFITFEIVIEGKSGRTALQRSYFMVKTHFRGILVRLVLFGIAVIIISSILGRVAAANGLLQLIQFLFSFFVSWYARAYIFLLYKQVRERTTFPQSISIRWIWIVSVIGWGIIILLLVGALAGIVHMPTTPLAPLPVIPNSAV